MSKFLKRLLPVLLASGLLLCAAAASAQEQPVAVQVHLLSEGISGPSPSAMLQPVPRGIEQDLFAGFEAYSDYIDVSAYGMSTDEFGDFYYSLLTTHPQYFFVDGMYWYYHNGEGIVTAIIPQYKYTPEEYAPLKAIYDAALAEAVAYARQSSTPEGMLLRANDYLCANYSYDQSLSNRSVELFFKEKSGVCQAYTQAYSAILNELGFTHTITLSDAMNHVWNMVLLDGEWYHIDVTWNDPNWNGQDIPMSVTHTSFLLSDEGIAASGHYEWDALLAANSSKYDGYFWKTINQAAALCGDKLYFVLNQYDDLDRYICCCDLKTGETTNVYTYSNGYFSYYKNYHPVWVYENMLYYGLRDTLYAVPLSGGEADAVYSTGDSGDWLWYPFQYGSELRVYSAGSPGSTGGRVHTVPFDIDYTLSLSQHRLETTVGESVQLTATLTPSADGEIRWQSSRPEVAAVDQNGSIAACSAGAATITAFYGDEASDTCVVIVHSDDALVLPENTLSIDASAFSGVAAEEIVLPEGLLSIGAQAFANNGHIRLVTIPGVSTEIAQNAFENCSDVTILCRESSAAAAFAQEQGMAFFLLD